MRGVLLTLVVLVLVVSPLTIFCSRKALNFHNQLSKVRRFSN